MTERIWPHAFGTSPIIRPIWKIMKIAWHEEKSNGRQTQKRQKLLQSTRTLIFQIFYRVKGLVRMMMSYYLETQLP